MNRNKLKTFVRKVLLEKLNTKPTVEGKLLKKTISFSGIQRECVCEGTVKDINEFASTNNLKFTISGDSYFGGHYLDEMTSYEFQPNPEFYGELMETSMSAREQLARICGTNDQVLAEVDVSNIENIVDFIFTNESFYEEKTNLVFEQIETQVNEKLYDKTQFTRLFEYLIKQSCDVFVEESIELTESEHTYAIQLISNRFFKNRNTTTNEEIEPKTECGKKSFSTGSAFENMQRIQSGHQMFL